MQRLRLDASSRAALPVWGPVALAGAVTLVIAVFALATDDLSWQDAVGIAC